MEIQIINKSDERIYPAKIYNLSTGVEMNNLEEIWNRIAIDGGINVKGDMYSIDGNYIKEFNGVIKKDELISIIKINDSNFCLDQVFTLKEAARKWLLADGSTIRKAIERDKFRNGEIKQSGSVWLVTSEAMERVFGPMGTDNCYIINQKELLSILSKVYLKDIKGGFSTLTERDKEVLEAMEKKATNIFMDGYINLRAGKIILVSNGAKEKPWQIIDSFEDYMVFLSVLEKRRLLTEERKLNIVKKILTI